MNRKQPILGLKLFQYVQNTIWDNLWELTAPGNIGVITKILVVS